MYKKDIKFVGFDGNEEVETAYFNLNRIETLKLVAKYGIAGDIQKGIQQIIDEGDMGKMINVLEDIILSAYGVKESNAKFAKTEASRKDFESGLAYPALFENLLTDPDELNNFAGNVLAKVTPEEAKRVTSENS